MGSGPHQPGALTAASAPLCPAYMPHAVGAALPCPAAVGGRQGVHHPGWARVGRATGCALPLPDHERGPRRAGAPRECGAWPPLQAQICAL